MKKVAVILSLIFVLSTTVNAASVPRESTPIYTTEAQIAVVERLVGTVFDKVINGMGYADARAESNYIIFNAWLRG